MSESHSPLTINVVRGSQTECLHSVSAVVMNNDAQIVSQWGNTELKIFPRSSIKPLQALALFQSGAYDQFKITDKELAIACASHSGEKPHTQLVESWLQRLTLSTEDLECGAHYPSYQNATLELLHERKPMTAIHNNCSGKHAGMLASCLALKVPTKGYVNAEHPLQIMIKKLIEEFCEIQLKNEDMAIDGCSIPTYYISLNSLALSMARFAAPSGSLDKYQSATKKILSAIVQNPYYLGGTDRYCTRMTEALNGKGFVKTGAEGVMFACLPELKTGVAMKVADGATRAAELGMSYILNRIGALSNSDYAEFSKIEIKNWNQILTGHIEVKN